MRIKEVKKLITEQNLQEQDLLEVNMSPKNLEKLAGQIDARAGMEFEMYVPDASQGDDEGELEPDYEQDVGVSDIDDACNFFYDGDYNSRREIQSLRESMQEDYQNWFYEKVDEDWHGGDGFDFFKDYLDREDPFDRDDALEQAEDYVRENEPDVEPGSDTYTELVSERLNELEEAYVQEQWDDQGRNYDYAREEYESEKQDDYDQGDWLDEAGIRTAVDVLNNYDIQWPYWTSRNEPGTVDINDIADEFGRMIGRPVNASQRYHGATRSAGHYVVEPDSSLDEPDSSSDGGIEFVSPPLPLNEMFDDLDKVVAWANRKGCYTNNTTGLHINVSVPDFDMSKLDYVKLALLLGDKYVLDQFGRAGNSYCSSALEEVKKRISKDPETAGKLLSAMKNGLEGIASKAIHSGSTSKYTSINTKGHYVEFRSPGGDWLNDETVEKIKPTLSRFVVALDAACDPDKYKEEYLKKLYQVLQPKSKDDTLSYFAKFAAGELPKQALKSFVRQAQLERKLSGNKTNGEKYWWKVSNPEHSYGSIEVVATNKQEAIDRALGPDGYPSWVNTRRSIEAEPLRPYEEKPQQGTTVAGRPNNPEGNWYLKNADTDEIFYRFNAANYQDAHTVLQQWKQENPDSNINAVYGHGRDEPTQPGGGTYRITSTGGSLIAGDEYGDDQAALQRAQYWARSRGVDVVVRNPQGQEVGRVSAFGEITPTTSSTPIPGSTLDLQRQRAAQTQQSSEYELYRISDGRSVTAPAGNPIVFRADSPEDAESKIARYAADFNLGAPELFAVRSVLQVPRTLTTPGQGQQVFTGEWKVVDPNGNEIYRFSGIGNSQSDANRVAIDWLRRNPRHLQGGVEVLPVMA